MRIEHRILAWCLAWGLARGRASVGVISHTGQLVVQQQRSQISVAGGHMTFLLTSRVAMGPRRLGWLSCARLSSPGPSHSRRRGWSGGCCFPGVQTEGHPDSSRVLLEVAFPRPHCHAFVRAAPMTKRKGNRVGCVCCLMEGGQYCTPPLQPPPVHHGLPPPPPPHHCTSSSASSFLDGRQHRNH